MKYVPAWRGASCSPSKIAAYQGLRKPACHGGMGCFGCAEVYNKRHPSLFGRVSAPGYWIKGDFLRKITGVFERQEVYEGQADIHWERDEGGTWAVIRVRITPTPGMDVVDGVQGGMPFGGQGL